VSILNARLADLTDHALALKQAHWNVKGAEFVSLHEMFDEMVAQTLEYADLVAERAVMLGGQAMGTLQAAAAGSLLEAYPVDITSAPRHLEATADRLGVLGNAIRASIDEPDRQGDADTADLFTEVSRGLDKQLWYLEAHLEQ
jgi:starvation-inducible DNA-binding protein